jgi:hypothetical protein
MTRVNLTLDLPESIEEKARAAGLLTSEKIFGLIEAELERQDSWNRLFGIMKELQAATEADFGHLSEDEFVDMVNDIVHDIRAENTTTS